jgi:DNA-binding transcriptional regulator YiaG
MIPIKDDWALNCEHCGFRSTDYDHIQACPECGSAETNARPMSEPDAPKSNSAIINELYRARTDRELTQAEIADRLGTYNTQISSWESGRCNPDERSRASIRSLLAELKAVRD